MHNDFNANRVMDDIAAKPSIMFLRLHVPAGIPRTRLQYAGAFLLGHLPYELPPPPTKLTLRIKKSCWLPCRTVVRGNLNPIHGPIATPRRAEDSITLPDGNELPHARTRNRGFQCRHAQRATHSASFHLIPVRIIRRLPIALERLSPPGSRSATSPMPCRNDPALPPARESHGRS